MEGAPLKREFILICFHCTVVIYENVLGFRKYTLKSVGVKGHRICNFLSNGLGGNMCIEREKEREGEGERQ